MTETEELDPVVVTRFLVSLDKAGLSARSAARRLSAMRGFCRFLVRERLSPSDPTCCSRLPASAENSPRSSRFDEVVRLLATPDVSKHRGLAIAPCSRSCTRRGFGSASFARSSWGTSIASADI